MLFVFFKHIKMGRIRKQYLPKFIDIAFYCLAICLLSFIYLVFNFLHFSEPTQRRAYHNII